MIVFVVLNVNIANSNPDINDGYIWLPTDITLTWAVTPISDEHNMLAHIVLPFFGQLQKFMGPSIAIQNYNTHCGVVGVTIDSPCFWNGKMRLE